MRRETRQHSFVPSEPLTTPVTTEAFQSEVRGWAKRLDVAPLEVGELLT
jgi:hypothetical protein